MSASDAASGWYTAVEVIDEARGQLQRIFIVFVLAMVGTIWALRAFLWDYLRGVTEQRLDTIAAEQVDIITRTPFDVMLLQMKIGLITGVLVAAPLLLWYGRRSLIRRGVIPDLPGYKRYRWGAILASAVLLVLGVMYAYALFFPFMFEFLVENALMMEIKPSFDIVMWTEFLILLTISFGLAAQVPLIMTVAAYTEIVRYETFRDKWKYAVVGIFAFGALFSPPDPFTQVMWGVPLVALYFFSLALAKLAANLNRAGSAADPTIRRSLRRKTRIALAIGALAVIAGFLVARYGLVEQATAELWPYLPASIRPSGTWSLVQPLGGTAGEAAVGVVAGILGTLLVATVYAIDVLRRPIPPSHRAMVSGDPSDLDLRPLDEAGVQAAPIEAFADLEEDEAVAIAQQALAEDEAEKAELVLDRFDEAQAIDAEAADEAAEAGEDPDVQGGGVTSAATGIVDAFTEDETTEDDIGGYWHDIVFIYQSLTSRMFRVVGVFLLVAFVTFGWLYIGGVGQLRRDFLGRVPGEVLPPDDSSLIVALHPVEVLIWAVKISIVIAAIVTLPLLIYYAWPALSDRGFVSGDRRLFLLWGGLLIGSVVGGSVLGYLFVAPPVISALVVHAVDAGMVISYRLDSFAWMVFYLTLGIGLLGGMLMSMVLFHLGGIVRYESMRRRWRGVVFWTALVAILLSPGSILTMFLVVVPMLLTFGVGLGVLWLLTIPGRLR